MTLPVPPASPFDTGLPPGAAFRRRDRVIFGDHQTPDPLAQAVVEALASMGIDPASIVEPSCGRGAFVDAARRQFARARRIVGIERNPDYAAVARARAGAGAGGPAPAILTADFFDVAWEREAAALPEPVLLVGNPPWVTTAALGVQGAGELAPRSNFKQQAGIAAVTGKGHFDVAELMLIRLLEAFHGRSTTLAMLVKTGVARRLLQHAWSRALPVRHAVLLEIDVKRWFGASASGALLVLDLRPGVSPVYECTVAPLIAPASCLGPDEPRATAAPVIGWRDGMLVRDAAGYDAVRPWIRADDPPARWRWRSGMKHDCAPVMEFERRGCGLWNGLGERVDIEEDCVFPYVKAADVAQGGADGAGRAVLVTQGATGADTAVLAERAPKTWAYLSRHAARLDARGSRIYRGRPRFSVFGVGPYTFAPWKVAISALHKAPRFVVLGPRAGRPVVVDDTTNHLSFDTEADAREAAARLSSASVAAALAALVFPDAKRPFTIEVLRRIDLAAVAAGAA